MKALDRFDFVKLSNYLNNGNELEKSIARYIIYLGLLDFENKVGGGWDTSLNAQPSNRQIMDIYHSLKVWNPLYNSFHPVKNTDHELLLMDLCIDFPNDFQSYYNHFRGQNGRRIVSDLIPILESLGVCNEADFEDFLLWLEEKGWNLDPRECFSYRYNQ